MSKVNIRIYVLSLAISIGLFAAPESVCAISPNIKSMYPLNLTSDSTNTLNYLIDLQIPFNFLVASINIFNHSMNYLSNYQKNYSGSWSFYANNRFGGPSAFNYSLSWSNMFNYPLSMNNLFNYSTYSCANQSVLPNL